MSKKKQKTEFHFFSNWFNGSSESDSRLFKWLLFFAVLFGLLRFFKVDIADVVNLISTISPYSD